MGALDGVSGGWALPQNPGMPGGIPGTGVMNPDGTQRGGGMNVLPFAGGTSGVVNNLIDVGSGIASYYGQTQANAMNAEQAEKNRAFQEKEAQKTRDWQMQMRGTAYQATMEDLRRAGLNPMLAFQQGATSTPTGASAGSVGNPTMESAIGKGLGSAMQAAQVRNELQTANIQRGLMNAQGLTQLAIAQRETNSAENLAAQTSLLRRTSGSKEQVAAWEARKAKMDEKYYEAEKVFGLGKHASGMVRDAAVTGAAGASMLRGRGGPPPFDINVRHQGKPGPFMENWKSPVP